MSTMLKGSREPIGSRYRLALLDLDGVVYRGRQPVDHAASSIREAQGAGMLVQYTTNNSSRPQSVVARQLRGFGLDVAPERIITSAVVAARMVARQVPRAAKVLVLGAEHLREEIAKVGLRIVPASQDRPIAVVQGWYPQLQWSELADVSYAVEHGALYFVTNRDLTLPQENGIAPGCGSMIQAVVNATGVEPVCSAGKPESAMYDEARALVAGDDSDPVARERCLAVGDRLDTDIEAGNRGGYDSMAVLTGVTNPTELMLAPPRLRPTYIVRDLRGLNMTQPMPRQMDERCWTCGGQSASFAEDGGLRVSDETSIDALRAACSLAWDMADRGSAPDSRSLPDFTVESMGVGAAS
ncbi:MAG: HAD-IIA family hydrolase [Bifidobacterium sp.]|jgi:HAD superfamily hydrolase (TIGR01450 family)|nr:HAD-IIA family hydrolase [Bifidobacterium sp.]MCI1865576.1 HAD-IIA family hydrolase [Bifidobacterium sp.]